MSPRTTIKQVGFVVQPLEHDTQTRALLAPFIPRYEPLYILSYGAPGTPASQGHWCIVMADRTNSVGDAFTFSLYGICRSAKRPPLSRSDSARSAKANRRVAIDPMHRELTRPEILRQSTFPVGSLAKPRPASMMWAPISVTDEIRRIPLRSSGPSMEYMLKSSGRLADCLSDESSFENQTDGLWPTYTFEDGDMKVLGIVEIAQLPHNIDPMTKIKAWSRLDFDLKFGEVKGADLDELRRDCVVRIVKVLTEQWNITCKDLPVGATPSVKHLAKLLDLAPAKL